MTIRRFALGMVAVASCTTDPPPCGEIPKLFPATGSGVTVTGALLPDAQAQSIVVSPDRRFLEYTFTRNGTVTTARYALSETPPTRALYFVTVRRPLPLAECAALVGRGPVIDSVEVKRGGAVISNARSYFSSARCGQVLTNKAASELNGSPDGVGVALGDSELGWVVGTRIALLSGDEVVVTVLDGAGEPFEVYASHEEPSYDLKLGTLTGTGSVRVP
jgi:hypothetical protein